MTQPIIPLVGGDSELANITPELYLVDSAGFSDYDAHRATIARDVADLVRGSAGRVRALQ